MAQKETNWIGMSICKAAIDDDGGDDDGYDRFDNLFVFVSFDKFRSIDCVETIDSIQNRQNPCHPRDFSAV